MPRLLLFCAFVFLVAGFNACSSDPALQFEQPQPLTGTEETAFPKALWGQYFNAQDSTTLLLTSSALVQRLQFVLPAAMQELQDDSIPYRLENGRLFRKDFPEGLPIVRRTPDSLYLQVTILDTLFAQNATHRLRSFKGMYFLNQQIEPNRWKVFCLSRQGRNHIRLQYLDDSVDRVKLEEIIPLRETGKVFLANPSQKDLRKFLRQGGFRQMETYTRVAQL
ncbi:hypothetical protein [Rufibacter hautae]|uniref:Uncharacterized protein n=1 Tax=Rufibacter hautae TaxID=2595005 RepID=A0A5B6TTZ8_9BACT|nr:hypothetical protein [Rufibacter hautae]KAA3440018.1 hypothetical protein FOA19_04945 [Rufibacter hautae]